MKTKQLISKLLDRFFFCRRNGHLFVILENLGVKQCQSCYKLEEVYELR